jgi:hypothetical protein
LKTVPYLNLKGKIQGEILREKNSGSKLKHYEPYNLKEKRKEVEYFSLPIPPPHLLISC